MRCICICELHCCRLGNVESSSADDGTRSARPRGLGGDFEFLPLKSPRNPITPIETSRVATLHPELYKNLREGARRVIGATAKPLYAIDGKAGGLDRRIPKTSLLEGGGPSADGGRSYQTVEGVSRRWKELSDSGRMSQPSGASFTFPGCLRLSTPPPLFWWFRSFSAYMRWSARMRISAAAALSSG